VRGVLSIACRPWRYDPKYRLTGRTYAWCSAQVPNPVPFRPVRNRLSALAVVGGESFFLEAIVNGIVGDYNYDFNCENSLILSYSR